MKNIAVLFLIGILLTGCSMPRSTAPAATAPVPSLPSVPTALATTEVQSPVPSETQAGPLSTASGKPLVPNFAHIIIFFFENHEFDVVVHNSAMPNYNHYIEESTLLTQYYAVTHPSLPNYIATFSGDTQNITSDCTKCFVNAPSLPDQIEASGRTWKAYLEGMPSPCYIGSVGNYVQKHDPFIYFDPIRLDATRCNRSILPLTELDSDLAAGKLPDFVYIMPDECHSAHDAYQDPNCSEKVTDDWLGGWMGKLTAYLQPRAAQEPYLIILTWDEGSGSHSCCGLPANAGGRVATVLVSPLAKSGFQDATPYTHYSLLKTIEAAWGLPYLGHAADGSNVLITAPWN